MLLDQQTLLEALPNISNIAQPVIIHLVAYERSASAPALSQSSTANSTPPTRLRPQAQRSTSLRQRNLSPVREAVDGDERERANVAPPVNDGRSQQPQVQVCVCVCVCMYVRACVCVCMCVCMGV